MAATSESPHLPPLRPDARRAVGQDLEATLLELIDLSLLGKQLQWSVTGPLLPVLHERLDDLVTSWRDLGDRAAERAVVVGFWPDGQADALVAAPEHRAVARGPVEDVAVVSLLVQARVPVIEHTRARLSRLGELDPVSQDMLLAVGDPRPAPAAALDEPAQIPAVIDAIVLQRERSLPARSKRHPDRGREL